MSIYESSGLDIYDMIYLSTAIGLSPGGSSTVHIYTQTIHRTTQRKTIHRTTQQFWKSAGRAPSWLVILWHWRYNRGKSTKTEEKLRKPRKKHEQPRKKHEQPRKKHDNRGKSTNNRGKSTNNRGKSTNNRGKSF